MGSTFDQSLDRIRKRLRDPDGAIWSDHLIRVTWNSIQKELSRKLPQLLCRFESYPVPQFEVRWSYMHDWEYRHLDLDAVTWPCLVYDQTLRKVICHVWESSYSIDAILYEFGEGAFGETDFGATAEGGTTDDGYHHTHFWEAGQVVTSDPLRIRLHKRFYRATLVAYDGQHLAAITEGEAAADPYYKTSTGKPVAYYRPDGFHNDLVLYPRPASCTFNEPGDRDNNHYAVTEDWEIDDYYLTGPAYRPEYFHEQEPDGIFGIHGWEYNYHMTGVTHAPDGAAVLSKEDDESETEDVDDYLVIVSEIVPDDVPEEESAWGENLDYPEWAVKYLEYGTLARLYGADTDGFIPSLRDYWDARYQVGLKVLDKFVKRSIYANRPSRLGGATKQRFGRHPSLPSGYPRCDP